MEIYKNYAEDLLFLHKRHVKLILRDFSLQERFDKESYAVDNHISENWLSRITYKTKYIGGGKKKIRPAYKIYESEKYGPFYIEYRSYSGLVAFKAFNKIKEKIEKGVPVERLKIAGGNGGFRNGKHGLFDFYLDTGNRYKHLYNKGDATHNNLFKDLKKHASFDDCEKVWRGEDFYTGEKDKDKLEALITLFILMFEQEINYGELEFQQFTNFSISKGFRPRDMIMGFLNMMYNNEIDYNSYPYWTEKNGEKYSTHFGFNKNQGYSNLAEPYKKYFEQYRSNYVEVKALFDYEEIKNSYIEAANEIQQNPVLEGLVTS
ncbi:hypothetical protein [Priestia megaterium]|uniref:hypothetical protein n=1 Tax=Priestia megaterium TaxID=1404 RepID=UPI002E1CFF53|nr:hypothetical protein [Priestia megaterium]